MKKDFLEGIKERMREMKEEKAAQLEKIRQKQEEIIAKIDAEKLAAKEAAEYMNLTEYETAIAEKKKAQTALDMYNERYTQIKKQEYITEEESDAVIDRLLEYEELLATDFFAACSEPLKQLDKAREEYLAAVADTERIITAWEREIHANYITRGARMIFDTDTGKLTERSKTPVPVRTIPYRGCIEADKVGKLLEALEDIYLS